MRPRQRIVSQTAGGEVKQMDEDICTGNSGFEFGCVR
jgi:hypothetical protein